ncbi:lipocalin family protein [uncultured Chitinophaga sp.]|uniref:lipocalin family protein n=1 Tax=uncultured Chitinophaga sp. TaxID=339340 RepID=UPI0025E04741|nr:lipocalin family protein [uncultured Chitinophaga sp.]
MRKPLLAIALFTVAACQQPVQEQSQLDSMTTGKDSIPAPVTELFKTDTMPKLDSIPVGKLPGRWTQPVQGIDSLMQGFVLKKNGQASALNSHSPSYEKWELVKDTFIIWSKSESDSVKTLAADTLLIRALTDTALVLFPINATPGYLEKYKKGKEQIKKVPKR